MWKLIADSQKCALYHVSSQTLYVEFSKQGLIDLFLWMLLYDSLLFADKKADDISKVALCIYSLAVFDLEGFTCTNAGRICFVHVK